MGLFGLQSVIKVQGVLRLPFQLSHTVLMELTGAQLYLTPLMGLPQMVLRGMDLCGLQLAQILLLLALILLQRVLMELIGLLGQAHLLEVEDIV